MHHAPSWLSVRTHGPRPRAALALLAGTPLLAAGLGATLLGDLDLVARLHEPAGEHLDQNDLVALIQQGRDREAFELAFEHGDELFETTYNALDGVGARVGDGQRFTRIPRADNVRPGEWATHVPARSTGPNAASCAACHNQPHDDGAGGTEADVVRDPQHSADLRRMIHRSTPHLFGLGALQRLAEEMTTDLQAQRDALAAQVQQSGRPDTAALQSKGVAFGELRATPRGPRNDVRLDFRRVEGVDEELVVKPFQWKGSVAFLRDFNRDASHNELGMQPVELVGEANDADGDEVVDEFSVGDLTALTIYLAAQPRPTSKLELHALGLIPPLASAEIDAIVRGRATFAAVGCAACHVPKLDLRDAVVREPSQHAQFRDARFPAGQVPAATGVTPAFAVRFDLTRDQPDNQVVVNGQLVHLGSFRTRADGTGAEVELFGDLKRHDLGAELAESIDETGSGRSTFLTENLWGVGSTAPYLHDGRATTLTEAILAHGGEARPARIAFVALPTSDQGDLIAFLDNLVLWKAD